MKTYYSKTRDDSVFKAGIYFLLVVFVWTTLVLPTQSHAQGASPISTSSPTFIPLLLKGVKVYTDQPFRFDFILDTGHTHFDKQQLKSESTKLIKYFMATLTMPEEDMWVNLSPYEPDRIVPEEFGKTEMGRDMLAIDFLLKQLTASMLHPDEEIGQKFWQRVYEQTQHVYGNIDLPIDTFNKVWIMPEHAVIYEEENMAFVTESSLKVMLAEDYEAQRRSLAKGGLEEDYLALSQNKQIDAAEKNSVVSHIIRDVVIPELEHEVNHGQHFAQLRQIYHAMILATWYKKALKESILSQLYVGQKKIDGVDINDPQVKEKIYQNYIKIFKEGVYKFIREEYDPALNETIPRQYFSGGIAFGKSIADVTRAAGEVNDIEGRSVGELITAYTHMQSTHQVEVNEPIKDILDFFISNINGELGPYVPEEPIQKNGFPILEAVKNYSAAHDEQPYVIELFDDEPVPGEMRVHKLHIDIPNVAKADFEILIIRDSVFEGLNHAGMGTFQLAVYAETEALVEHELIELQRWIEFVLKNKIATVQQIKDGLMTTILTEWANDLFADDLLDRQNNLILFGHEVDQEGRIREAEHGGRPHTYQPFNGTLLTKPIVNFDVLIRGDRPTFIFKKDIYRYFQEIFRVIEEMEGNLNNPILLINKEDLRKKMNNIKLNFQNFFLLLLAMAVEDPKVMLAEANVINKDSFRKIFEEFRDGVDATAAAEFIRFSQLEDREDDFTEAFLLFINWLETKDEAFRVQTKAALKKRTGRDEDQIVLLPARAELFPNGEDSRELDPKTRVWLEQRSDNLKAWYHLVEKGGMPKIINFGDVHGENINIDTVMEEVADAKLNKRPVIVIGHGDYFTRGGDNIEVFRKLKMLIELKEDRRYNIDVHLLLGNHDEMILRFLLYGEWKPWLKFGGISLRALLNPRRWKENIGLYSFFQFLRHPFEFMELRKFMLTHLTPTYVDPWNGLHIHAGMKISRDGVPIFTDDLNQEPGLFLLNLQQEWDVLQAEYKQTGKINKRRLLYFFESQSSSIFWTRSDEWLNRLAREVYIDIDDSNFQLLKRMMIEEWQSEVAITDEAAEHHFEQRWFLALHRNPKKFTDEGLRFKWRTQPTPEGAVLLDNLLGSLGYNYIVMGHERHRIPLNIFNSIFGIDFSNKGHGFVTFNEQGDVKYHPVEGEVQTLITRDQLLEHIREEYTRIDKRLNGESTDPTSFFKPVYEIDPNSERYLVLQAALNQERDKPLDINKISKDLPGYTLPESKVMGILQESGAVSYKEGKYQVNISDEKYAEIYAVAERMQERLLQGSRLDLGHIAREVGLAVELVDLMMSEMSGKFIVRDDGAWALNAGVSAAAVGQRPVDQQPESTAPGGVDMNPRLLDLQLQGGGVNFEIPQDVENLQSIEFDGLQPIIFRILPTNLPLFLGENKPKMRKKLSWLNVN